MPISLSIFASAFLRPMLGMPQAFARRLGCESGVENVSEMMPATGVMSDSGAWITTISSVPNVSSASGTPGGMWRSMPIATPVLNAW